MMYMNSILRNPFNINCSFNEIGIEEELFRKIKSVVFTSLKSIALVFLHFANPKISFVGFLFGIIEKEWAKKYLDRISAVWEKSKGISLGTLCLFSYMSLPMTIAACSFFAWARFGTYVAEMDG